MTGDHTPVKLIQLILILGVNNQIPGLIAWRLSSLFKPSALRLQVNQASQEDEGVERGATCRNKNAGDN